MRGELGPAANYHLHAPLSSSPYCFLRTQVNIELVLVWSIALFTDRRKWTWSSAQSPELTSTISQEIDLSLESIKELRCFFFFFDWESFSVRAQFHNVSWHENIETPSLQKLIILIIQSPEPSQDPAERTCLWCVCDWTSTGSQLHHNHRHDASGKRYNDLAIS